MADYSPELIRVMQTALDDVRTKVPADQATQGIKLQMAEFILKAAAEGQTTYDGLLAATSDQVQTIVSMLA